MTSQAVPSGDDQPSDRATEARRGRAAGALASGLDILELLAQQAEGLGVTAIARALGLDKGNAHRLLRMLEEREYVEQDPTTKTFRASVQLVALAGNLLRSMDLVSIAQPVMRQLAHDTGEAVHLARRTRAGGVYVARERQSFGIVTVETEIGAQPVIHATATGKALYCMDTDEDVSRVAHEPLRSYTPRTLTRFEDLLADLRRVRACGYAVDDEELNLEVRCVAAPIFDFHGSPVASLGLSGPAGRVARSRVADLGNQVRSAALRITHELGGHVPDGFGTASSLATERATD